MQVGIDATPLTLAAGGLRRYVVELTRALAALFPEDDYHLMTDQVWELPPELAKLPNVLYHSPESFIFPSKWWSLGLPWALVRLQIDVFHGSDFSIPYLPVRPSVLMIHDLSPWKPAPLRPVGSDRVRSRTPHLVPLATRIVTPSEAIRREAGEFFGVSSSKIKATPLAAAESFRPVDASAAAARAREKGIDFPYIMFLGAGDRRKNVAGLIEGWRRAREQCPDLSLVLAGPRAGGDGFDSDEPGLHVLGHLADKEVAELLSGASAFVYPSLYEGFGLPVLEAMQAGAPLITSKDPAITEVTEGAALQVDATSVSELCAAILSVVNHAGLQQALREKGRRRASLFSWRSTALLTHSVYVEAIRGF